MCGARRLRDKTKTLPALWQRRVVTMVPCPGGNRCGRSPGMDGPARDPRALKAGRAADAIGPEPGLEPGRRPCPPNTPWFSRVPSCGFRQRGDGCAHGPDCPPAGNRTSAQRRRPARAWDHRASRGRSRVSGAETRRAHPGPASPRAVRGPPSEDEGRRMPMTAAPRFRPRPGLAIPLRRRPRRGAEHRRL